MKHLKIFLAVVLLAAGLQLNAQTKPAVVKFKPPKLYTQLGSFRDSVGITVEQAENIIDKALNITDDKKNVYSISSYQFLYRKKGVTEDEATGKVSPATSIVSQLFKITPLPKTWVENIQQQLQSGEELFFFDVIARDAAGKVMYAPNLKIMVK
jgi:hypothetical protein